MATPGALILTHAHFDHVKYVKKFLESNRILEDATGFSAFYHKDPSVHRYSSGYSAIYIDCGKGVSRGSRKGNKKKRGPPNFTNHLPIKKIFLSEATYSWLRIVSKYAPWIFSFSDDLEKRLAYGSGPFEFEGYTIRFHQSQHVIGAVFPLIEHENGFKASHLTDADYGEYEQLADQIKVIRKTNFARHVLESDVVTLDCDHLSRPYYSEIPEYSFPVSAGPEAQNTLLSGLTSELKELRIRLAKLKAEIKLSVGDTKHRKRLKNEKKLLKKQIRGLKHKIESAREVAQSERSRKKREAEEIFSERMDNAIRDFKTGAYETILFSFFTPFSMFKYLIPASKMFRLAEREDITLVFTERPTYELFRAFALKGEYERLIPSGGLFRGHPFENFQKFKCIFETNPKKIPPHSFIFTTDSNISKRFEVQLPKNFTVFAKYLEESTLKSFSASPAYHSNGKWHYTSLPVRNHPDQREILTLLKYLLLKSKPGQHIILSSIDSDSIETLRDNNTIFSAIVKNAPVYKKKISAVTKNKTYHLVS